MGEETSQLQLDLNLPLEETSQPQQEEHPALEETSQPQLAEISRQKENIQAIGNRQLLQTTTAPDPTTLPPSQCIDEGCSSEHDGWGECVDFSTQDFDWMELTTEFDLSAGHVPGKCGNVRQELCDCCKCMKAKIHHTTTTTPEPTKPWWHYQSWGRK